MDDFFKKERCDRCGKSLKGGRIMSMLNTECICMECKDLERNHPKYDMAVETEMKEVRKGNMNYKGILEKD